MANKDNHAIKFGVISLIMQYMIVILILTAEANVSLQAPQNVETLLQRQTGELEQKVNSVNLTDYTPDDLSTGGTGIENPFDPITMLLNVGRFLGAFVTILTTFGASWLTLSLYTAQAGIYGWFVTLIVVVWQIATIYYILKFVFPNRFGSNQ